MSTEQDLKDSLDHIQTQVAGLATAFASMKQTIADLQAQIAAGTPVSQEQLDALEAEAQGVEDALTALGQ